MPAVQAVPATQPTPIDRKASRAIPGEKCLPWRRSASRATTSRRVPFATFLISMAEVAGPSPVLARIPGPKLASKHRCRYQLQFAKPVPNDPDLIQRRSYLRISTPTRQKVQSAPRFSLFAKRRTVSNEPFRRKSPSSANAPHRQVSRRPLCESGIRRVVTFTALGRGALSARPASDKVR
jgi:hypothetical protein